MKFNSEESSSLLPTGRQARFRSLRSDFPRKVKSHMAKGNNAQQKNKKKKKAGKK